jgi:hypothetical protein
LFGYRLLPGGSDGEFRFYLAVRTGKSYRAQILVDAQSEILSLYVFLTDDPLYPVELQESVMELASRTAEVVVFGSVCVQVDSGAVLFKDAFDCSGLPATPDHIARWLNHSAFPIALFETAYLKLLSGRGNAYAALQAALIEQGAHEGKSVSEATRRALIMLVTD